MIPCKPSQQGGTRVRPPPPPLPKKDAPVGVGVPRHASRTAVRSFKATPTGATLVSATQCAGAKGWPMLVVMQQKVGARPNFVLRYCSSFAGLAAPGKPLATLPHWLAGCLLEFGETQLCDGKIVASVASRSPPTVAGTLVMKEVRRCAARETGATVAGSLVFPRRSVRVRRLEPTGGVRSDHPVMAVCILGRLAVGGW
ncbi:hypothetical protein LZ31DRAFT_21994 [Colletotrichum somersetense]|nr:hypothetical protein LZ31DRAFT_21994 [Colletotrichum somersetense]